MHVTVFMGASIDGFIARPDGAVDFLDSCEPPQDDMGFGALLERVDVLVMGRNTFDFVAGGDWDWPYGELPVRVATSRPLEVAAELSAVVAPVAGDAEAIVTLLEAEGFETAYVDGGLLGAAFFTAGLVDELTITTVPILIGDGLRVFGPLGADQPMELVATATDPNGMTQSTWRRPATTTD